MVYSKIKMNWAAASVLLTSAVLSNTALARYAVVDMQSIILNVSDGKSARETLEKEINAKKKDFEKEQQALMKLNEEWKTQAAVLSESARMKKQQEFQEKFLAAQQSEKEFNNEVRRKEQTATQSIAVKVSKIVSEMSKQKGYEIVFEANTAGVIYVKEPLDITKEVIKEYEKQGGGKSDKKSEKPKDDKKAE